MTTSNLYKVFIFANLFMLRGLFSVAQTINGAVVDAETQQPLPFSNIVLVSPKRGVVADSAGRFVITLPSEVKTPKLSVSMLGYSSETFVVTSEKTDYRILLKPSQSALQEIVVTGVSKATLIRENPVAITSISSKAIDRSTESNIIDVLVKNVPGLNAVKTGPNVSKPFIRGLGYNRVLTLYDGIRQEGQQWGDEHGIEVDAYNIERAEVIKGPASIMYGSDAVAGVVSMMPSLLVNQNERLQGKFISEYQTNNALIGNGLKLTYAKNKWAFALRGSYRMAKNYVNKIDGRVYNTNFKETNFSASAQYFAKNGFSNLNFTVYDNLQGIPDGSRDSLTRRFTHQVFEANEDDVTNRPIVSPAMLNSYQLSPLHQRIQHYRLYSNNHYGLGNAGDIDFQLAFQQNIRREYNHPTQPEQAGMHVRLNTVNYGFRYNLPVFQDIELSAGVNGMFQNNQSKDATDFPIPDYNLFDAGGYIFAKWKKEKWTISGGARYDVRQLNGKDFYTHIETTTGFNRKANTATVGAELQFPAFNKTFHGTSISLGTTYQINELFSLKANVARGYRAPSITEFASNGLDPGAHIIYLGNRNFVPEFSLQEDISADFHGPDLSFSLSVFNNNIRNYIYLSQLTDANGHPVLDGQQNKTYQYQQAIAQLYGSEATLNIHPNGWKGFSFDNAFSLIYGFNRKQSYENTGINGEYLPLIPPAKLLSSVNQLVKLRSSIFSELGMQIEGEFTQAQNRYLALNSTETATPGYTLFNASANLKINYGKNNSLQLQMQVNNVFDKAYQSNLSRLKYFEYYTQSPNGRSGMYGMGRNFCLKLIAPF